MTDATRSPVRWSPFAASLATALAALIGTLSDLHAADDILIYRGADRDARILAGAQKEGQVIFYSTMIANQALRPLTEAFNKKYPQVKMSYWRAPQEDIMQKINAEYRANNMVGDVIAGTGIGEMSIESGIAQPYFVPALEQYPKSYHDPQGRWTPTNLYYYGVAVNTKLVAAKDAPKTFDDLLDPKWKGKMAWRVGELTGAPLFISNLRTAWGEERALAYLSKLKGQNIINFGSGSARTLVDRVMAGEYPIALNIYANHPLISAGKGAPVTTQLLDPIPSSASTMVIPKNAPHPHGAMLLADYILSKEGQGILAKAEYYPAHPEVAALPEMQAVVPRVAGVPENFLGPDRFLGYAVTSEKIYQDMFK